MLGFQGFEWMVHYMDTTQEDKRKSWSFFGKSLMLAKEWPNITAQYSPDDMFKGDF